MKKLFFLIAMLVCASSLHAFNNNLGDTNVNEEIGMSLDYQNPYSYRQTQGMVYPGMSYREYKNLYNTGDYNRYTDTKYSPFWSGFASFCITGLGQACCGQVWRGLGFWAGKWALTGFFADNGSDFLSLVAYCGISVWSIIDAAKVAKIKSMYYSDIRRGYRSDISVEMYPTLNCAPTFNGLQASPAMTLAITF